MSNDKKLAQLMKRINRQADAWVNVSLDDSKDSWGKTQLIIRYQDRVCDMLVKAQRDGIITQQDTTDIIESTCKQAERRIEERRSQ